MSKLNRDKLEEMTAVELKELLQKQGLSTSGNKQALVDRLFNANPGGAGVFVIEAVSAPHPKKDAAAPPTRHVPIATAAEAAEDAAADPTPDSASPVITEAPPAEPTPPTDDAAALITQLKDLIAQAQTAAEAAQKAQQSAEAAAASVKQKKEKKGKKGDKKKDKKKKE